MKVTTYPDLSTPVETYFRDGSLRSATGTAVHPVRYEYGVETSGADASNQFVKEIRLHPDGTDSSEWVKSYRDALGRAYKTLYPDGAFSRSFYNQNGQLQSQVDPDGVVTLFAYNARGELQDRALDMNRNGVIDYNSSDRVTRTITDVVTDHGTAVRRSLTFVWNIEGSSTPLLTTVVETSVDGLRSWQSGFGLTNFQQTVFNGNGGRTVTAVAPDNSTTVSEYLFGRVQTVTRRDANAANWQRQLFLR